DDRYDMGDDGDGVPDSIDAFPFNSTESLDTDGDGIGDNRDNDDDNDGFIDLLDSRPKIAGQNDEIEISPSDSQLDNGGSLTIGPTFLFLLVLLSSLATFGFSLYRKKKNLIIENEKLGEVK
ncbi:MAG: hypothetical protein CMB31_05595, partial [Euryarchaeota archaeon]|nr:hypothetical protein [Euryarchaeota archaeon]